MTLPKKLEEKRDVLAREFENYAWRAAPYTEVTIDSSYREGFNSACNLLLPEIKKLEEALEWYGTKGEGAYSDAKLYLRAESTLQSLREFLGSEG